MRKFLVAAALLLCIGVSAFAQTSSISGTVSDPSGATVGNCVSIVYPSPAKGAQCNPKANGSKACFGKQVVKLV